MSCPPLLQRSLRERKPLTGFHHTHSTALLKPRRLGYRLRVTSKISQRNREGRCEDGLSTMARSPHSGMLAIVGKKYFFSSGAPNWRSWGRALFRSCVEWEKGAPRYEYRSRWSESRSPRGGHLMYLFLLRVQCPPLHSNKWENGNSFGLILRKQSG